MDSKHPLPNPLPPVFPAGPGPVLLLVVGLPYRVEVNKTRHLARELVDNVVQELGPWETIGFTFRKKAFQADGYMHFVRCSVSFFLCLPSLSCIPLCLPRVVGLPPMGVLVVIMPGLFSRPVMGVT